MGETVMRIVQRFKDSQRPLSGDRLLEFLLHWARDPSTIEEKDLAEVKQFICNELTRTTRATINRVQEEYQKAFDALITPSALWNRDKDVHKDRIKLHCILCHKRFDAWTQVQDTKCFERVRRHSSETFTSNAGNTCCSKCNKPLSFPPCMDYDKEHSGHELETDNTAYEVKRRKKTGLVGSSLSSLS